VPKSKTIDVQNPNQLDPKREERKRERERRDMVQRSKNVVLVHIRLLVVCTFICLVKLWDSNLEQEDMPHLT
jgi:hypothetical protein